MHDTDGLQPVPLVIDFGLWYRRLRLAAFALAREKGYPEPHLPPARGHYQRLYQEQRTRLAAFCCQATGSITEDNEMRQLLREYGVSDNEALTATLALYDLALAHDPRPPEERVALAIESWRASCQAFFERGGGTRIR